MIPAFIVPSLARIDREAAGDATRAGAGWLADDSDIWMARPGSRTIAAIGVQDFAHKDPDSFRPAHPSHACRMERSISNGAEAQESRRHRWKPRVSQIRPEILVLNAGAKPVMGRLDQISWADFSVPWEHDVKAGLHWLQAALNLPLAPGSRVLVVSSGAAIAGSPLSGGYGGAKRMLWFMARYANRISTQRQLGICFQTIIPQQIILGTGIGDTAAAAYASSMGIEPEEFVTRFGAPMPPRKFGDNVIAVLEDPRHDEGFAFGLSGDAGV
jgi:hypothetical protein